MTGQVDVAVVGGGLAGIAAALRLADRGATVTLLESRPRLGGATYSFERDGLTVDTGQHVFLRCYTAYLALLRRLGTADLVEIQDRFEVPVLAPGRPPHLLRRARYAPAPLHLLPALAGYRPLSVADRVAAMRAAAALRFVDPDAPGTDAHSLGEFFARHGQSPEVVRRLWELVAVAALNVPPAEASLALAARVFRTGLLESARAGDIGRPRVGLSALHGDPAARILGPAVRTRAKVRRIVPVAGGFTVHTENDTVPARTVLLAVPHPAAAHLVPAGAVDDPGRWAGLSGTAIVNVHLVYDRTVTDFGMAAAVDSPVQWVFDRTAESGMRGAGQYLAVSLSAADALVGRPAAELIAEQRAGIEALLPAARTAELTSAFVTREPRATFRQAPGSRALRPPAGTGLPGLALAGAWVGTGWPDTMEGAVRSGHTAADLLAGHLGQRPSTVDQPDTRAAVS
ncbi:hydroxysqualene dehydroxylase HpnE [Actinocatenispora rupis]|uniref:Phytoene dehydrogenase n=1 Tax=Actinocatenispora rupis TaxID=519421 RepID=A0A8J3IZP1_9ACTN|nr:hydroxysqualene dehydroxylase HpnE [Actinocatenispora rupis]GID11805.1 phytoene dehydrogenase [Actinocatenispora rupis]